MCRVYLDQTSTMQTIANCTTCTINHHRVYHHIFQTEDINIPCIKSSRLLTWDVLNYCRGPYSSSKHVTVSCYYCRCHFQVNHYQGNTVKHLLCHHGNHCHQHHCLHDKGYQPSSRDCQTSSFFPHALTNFSSRFRLGLHPKKEGSRL